MRRTRHAEWKRHRLASIRMHARIDDCECTNKAKDPESGRTLFRLVDGFWAIIEIFPFAGPVVIEQLLGLF